jgi:hypothetical protein
VRVHALIFLTPPTTVGTATFSLAFATPLLEHPMAKRAPEPKPATQAPEEKFVELMLVAADFVKSCGSLDHAKKSLTDAGNFIKQAGGVSNAERALSVLESLKEKIG